jgi:predicted tellurium resistance membrane protein TerC
MEFSVAALIALVTLSAMEIVLGIDNIIFIAIITAKLPENQQAKARRVGLLLAMGMRVLLLLSLSYVMKLDQPVFHISSVLDSVGLPSDWIKADGPPPVVAEAHADAAGHSGAKVHRNDPDGISIKDMILIGGGLFLLCKSVWEIHHKVEGHTDKHGKVEAVSFGGVLFQIAMLDIIFSLDSVITAVGMAREIWVMIAAVIIAIGVMMLFANPISKFVERHPTITILALSFLILIGVMLIVEGFGQHINKGYIYFAMAFSLVVELLNMRVRTKAPVAASEH